jgi:hypothetical protein
LLARVEEVFRAHHPSILGFDLRVQAPRYKLVDVAANVTKEPHARANDVAGACQAGLRQLFAVTDVNGRPNLRMDFGYNLGSEEAAGEVAWSDVVAVLQGTPGVRKVSDVTLNGALSDVSLEAWDFPALGGANLSGLEVESAL